MPTDKKEKNENRFLMKADLKKRGQNQRLKKRKIQQKKMHEKRDEGIEENEKMTCPISSDQ